MKRARSVAIQMTDSAWSVGLTRHDDGSGELELFWRDAVEPTHTRTLTSDEVDTLRATLENFQ